MNSLPGHYHKLWLAQEQIEYYMAKEETRQRLQHYLLLNLFTYMVNNKSYNHKSYNLNSYIHIAGLFQWEKNI